MVSIIIPTYNEEKYISKCIESLLLQDYPKYDLEVIFVDGMSNDNTKKIVAKFSETYSFIKLLNNPYKIVPYAMNIGIKAAKGNIIIRLDAHALYPSNYFSCLVAKLTELNADNVGGVCLTLPINNNAQSIAIAEALSCRFGIGNSYFRIGATKEMKVDTVPFGCFRRDIFDRIGMFDEGLVRNQDDEFNGRIIKNGGTIYLIPDIVVKYFARDKFSKVAKMYFQYGLFKPLVNKKLGSPATIRQFFPPLLVLGLVIGFILSFLSQFFLIIYISTLTFYVCVSIFFGYKASKCHKIPSLIFLMPYTFFLIHISYGYGYIKGLFKLITRQKFCVEINR